MSEEAIAVAEDAVYAEELPTGVRKRAISKKVMMAVIAVVVVVVVASVGTYALTSKMAAGSSSGNTKAPHGLTMVQKGGSIKYDGAQVPVKQTFEQPIDFKAAAANSSGSGNVTNVFKVSAACSWTDDLAGSEPDCMYFELVAPDGLNKSADTEGTSGNCVLTIQYNNMTDKAINDNSNGWKLKVTCNKAGHKDKGPFGRIITPDSGNDWAAKVDFSFYGVETASK